MPHIMLTEQEVADMMAAARDGNRDSLGQVLEVFRHYLLAVAKREMDLGLSAKAGPSDLVQETLLEAQRDFERFGGTSESDIQAWLRRLLLNNLANFRRHYRNCAKRSVQREVAFADAGPVGVGHIAASPVDNAEDQEERAILRELIVHVSPDYRTLFEMWYDDLSFDEIGERTGRSAAAVRMMWTRAVRRLQELAAKSPAR